MPHSREMYRLHGEKVRELRKALDLTQEQFADQARISRRTLQEIERNGRPIGREVFNLLTEFLKVPQDSLVAETIRELPAVGRSGSEDQIRYAWLRPPKLPPDQSRELAEAVRCAMSGRLDRGVGICKRVLRGISKDNSFEEFAAVLVKLVTFLDEMGKHREALKELEGFFADIENGYGCSSSTRMWAEYHKGICLRRLADGDPDLFLAAEHVFKRLEMIDDKLGVAAVHQLGVVYLKQAAHMKEDDNRTQRIEMAEALFLKAQRAWQRTGGAFREAYPLRRLGQLYAIQGQYAVALEHFLDALDTFYRYHAYRYVKETRQDIRSYISDATFTDRPVL